MEKRKVFRILNHWSEQRLEEFGQFLACRQFDSSQSVVDLFNAYRGGEKIGFREGKMKRVCHQLLEIAEQYLIMEYAQRPAVKTQLLSEIMVEEGIDEIGDKVKKGLRSLEKEKQSTELLRARFRIESNLMYAKAESRKYERLDEMDEVLRKLDTYYCLEKERHQELIRQSEMISGNKYVNRGYGKSDLLQLNKTMGAQGMCWKWLNKLNGPESLNLYVRYKKIAEQHLSGLEKRTQHEIIIGILRYVVSIYHQGIRGLDNEYIYWVQKLGNTGLKVPEVYYRNAFTMFVKQKRLTEAKKMMNKLGDQLSIAVQQLIQAQIWYYEGKLEDMLELLEKIDDVNVVQRMQISLMQITALYELGKLADCLKLCIKIRSRMHSLRSLDDVNRRKVVYFCNVLIDLIRQKTPVQKLKLSVSKKSEVANKEWLLRQIENQLQPAAVRNQRYLGP